MSLDFGKYRRMRIPEGRVKQIMRESDGLVLWTEKYLNRVRQSVSGDDGSIYNGMGYKDGYRIRSGGAEGVQDGATCTGFIFVNPGDVIRISGCSFADPSSANAVNVADVDFVNVGQLTTQPANYGIFAADGGTYADYGAASVVQEKDGVWAWTVPPEESGVRYIRVTGYRYGNAPGADMIVTINEEIK